MQSEDRVQSTEDRGQTAVYRCASYSKRLRGRTATTTQSSALRPQSSERGSTLVISLIMMIVMMMLGVMAVNTSDTQYKLAGNLQFENMAMNNAEVAIDTATRWLETNAAIAPSAVPVAGINPLTMTWTNSDAISSVQVIGPDGTPNDNQRYVIGYVSTNPVPTAGVGLVCPDPKGEQNYNCVNTYLITARGQGGRGATKLVQVYYSVPLR